MIHLKTLITKLSLLILLVTVGMINQSLGQTCPVSNEITITVVPDPAISIVGATTICQGGSATLTATPTGGTATCTILWQSSPNGTTGWAAASGTNNTTTYIASGAATGTIYYRALYSCTGIGCDGATSNTQAVTVNPNLSITTQPVNIDECVGGNLGLSVVVSGAVGTITYLWEQSATGTGGWSNASTAVTANNLSTYTPPSTTAGTTYYRVTIAASGNGCSNVISTNATVIVRPDLAITAQPVNIDECVGGNLTLTVTTTGGSGTITYLWEQSATGTGGWSAASTTASANNLQTYRPPSTAAGTTYYRVTVSASGNDCQPVTSTNSTVIIRPDLAITAQPVNIDECVGGNLTLTVTTTGGSGTISYLWEQSATGTGGWSAASTTASANNLQVYTPPSTAAGTTYYRVTVSASGNDCQPVTSTNSTVIIRPDLAITAQPVNIDECVGGNLTLTVTTTGGSGTISYLWEQSATGTGGWSAASTTASANNLQVYTPPSTAAGTTYYRVTVSASGNDCQPVTSTNSTVIIRPDLAITAQPINIDECAGGNLTISVTTTGGSGTITYLWEQSATGTGGWSAASTTASANNLATYTPPSTTAGTTYYRVTVSASGNDCQPVTSNNSTVIIRPNLAITAQPVNIDECVGGNLTISVTTTGGSGVVTYLWEQSATGTGGWSAASTAASANNFAVYTPPSTAAGTTYYRVTVSAGGNGCPPVTSTNSTVIIRPDLAITAQPVNIDECVGGNLTLTVTTTGGSGNITYLWEQSATGTGGWSAASTTASANNLQTYRPPSTAAGTTYYRVTVSASGNDCQPVTSTNSTVIIRPDLAITAQPVNIDECVGGNLTLTVTTTGGSGTITYLWEQSATGTGGWSAASTTASANNLQVYTPPSTTAGTTYYRVTVSASGNDCQPVTSTNSTVIIRPDLAITAQPLNIDECVGGNLTLTVTTTGGSGTISYLWEQSATGTGGWSAASTTASANNLQVYTPPSTAAGTTYYRVTVSASGNDCQPVTSTNSTVIIRPDLAITAQPINIDECAGGNLTISVTTTGGSGTITYLWEQSATGTGGWSAASTTASANNLATYTPPSVTAGTTYYRVTVSASGNDCQPVTSNNSTVIIRPNLAITAQPVNIDECVGGNLPISITTTGGSGTVTYLWEQSATGTGGWSAASTTASANNLAVYTPPSTVAGTTYYRVTVSAGGNGCPPVTSTNSTVIVRPDLAITAQPVNIDECVGGNLTLTVTTTGGSGTISYLWEQSATGTGGWSAASTTASANNLQTYRPPSTAAGTTYYRVTVSASGNDCQPVTSTNSTVIIRPDLAITAQPVNIDECVGGNLTLTVTTTGGSGTITYLWEQSATGTGGWSAASTTASANNLQTYTPPSTVAGTTYYRVTVSASGNDCQPVTSTNSTVIIRPDLAITAQPVNIDECVGGNLTLTVTTTGGSGTISYLWEQSATGTGGWSAASTTASANNLQVYTPPSTAAGTTYYRVTVSASGNDCQPVTSTNSTVIIRPDLVITAQPVNIDECAGGNLTISVTTTGGSGTITYLWQQSATGTGGWSAASTTASANNLATYTPPSVTAGTTYYRVTVSASGNDCQPVTSNNSTVIIRPNLAITAQPVNIDECVGGNLPISVTTTGGSGTVTYLWEQSATGTGGWSAASTTASANNFAVYTPPSTAAGTTYYRVTVSAGGNGCPPVTSTNSTVIIRPDLAITAQPVNIDECVGGNLTLTVTTTGGSGTITYLWEQSATGTGGWSAASTTASANNLQVYTPPSTAAGTTYYRVTVSASGNDCQPVTSTNSTVIIRPDLAITAQPVNIDECVGGNLTLTVTTTGGSGTITYLWEQSATGTGGWSAASTTASANNLQTYTPPSTTAGTTYYRVTVSASGNDCQPVTSTNSTVIIRPDLAITAQPVNIDECVGGNLTLTVTTTGGSGTISYLWEQSATGTGGWSAASTTASANNLQVYTPPSTVAGTTYYRVTVSASGNDCQPVTSTNSTVIIRPDLAITAQPVNIDECAGGNLTISVTTTGGSGTITYLWEQSATGTGGWSAASTTASANNLATYTPPSTTAGTTYYRVTVSASGNDCQPVTSNNSTVIIRPNLAITAQPVNIDECVGGNLPISITTTGGSGTVTYLWEQSATGTGGWSAASTTASANNLATYTPPSTTAGTTYYRVTVSAGGNGCPPVTSTNSTVIIRPDLVITAQPQNIDQCVGGSNTISVTTTGGSGTITYLWEESATGTGGWSAASTAVSANNLATYTPPSTTAGTTFYRVTVSASGNDCQPVTSTNSTVIIRPDLAITSQPANITECIDGTDVLTVVVTGGSGTITYLWEQSATGTGGWSAASTAVTPNNLASYTPPSATAGTTFYRVTISAGNNGCGPQTSTTATVIVNPKPTISVNVPVNTICIGGSVTLNATVAGGVGCTIQWQSSPVTPVNWLDIPGGNAPSYTTPALSGDLKYRAKFTCTGSGCCN
jgi:hypothetical protein